ncbi:glycosyltransferase [Xanthobacter oligotrophicus]|uniref:glycosyltransferase n=2 Tax=Xanthobacter oligotrophicus TaxID=2607286 RepID=UPI00165D9B48|nr:glycosyltransferase [Xanthobacter oligotrophicus]
MSEVQKSAPNLNAQFGKETEEPRLIWWLQDQERQNFGDYLTDFLWSNLARGMRIPADGYRLLGSAISDWIVHDDLSKLGSWEHGRIVFWCCGMRDETPLQPETLARSIFCGVRGPLTRAALKLPETTVMGDPGLLLPLLHRPQHAQRTAGKSICAPHFHESATDDQLQKLTGADVIVRPAIDRSPTALKILLDEIATSDFVLAGSLHAAIVACAYGVPFCYFDSGYVDVPFKWRDFSASVNIGTFFVDNVAEGRQTYETAIRPRLRKPLLFPILAAAPFAVRTRYLFDAALLDSQQIGGDRQLAKDVLASFADAANNGIALFDQQSILAKLADADRALTAECTAHAATLAKLADADRALTAEAEERFRVAQDLDKAFRHPWRPGMAWAQYLLLKSLAFASTPFSPHASERFKRSAQKRSPRRYKKMLAALVVASRTTEREKASPLAIPLVMSRGSKPALPAVRHVDLREAFLSRYGNTAIDFPAVENPKVSVIIPAYRNLADLEMCLRSLAAHQSSGPSFEVIIVDDCPSVPVNWALPASGGLVKIDNEENLGFLLTCNRGAKAARGEFLCFLNSDTIVSPGWLAALVEALEETPDAALAGCMLLNVDGTIQDAGWRILSNGWGYPIGRNCDANDGAYTYRRHTDCVTGACFVTRSAVFARMGGLDSLYVPAFYEEFDFAFRARQLGFKTIYEPRSRVVHLGSASYGAEQRDRLSGINHRKFCDRFAQILGKQPYDTGDPFEMRQDFSAGPVVLVVDAGIPRPDRHAGDVTMSQYLSMLARGGWRVVFAPMGGQATGSSAEALERLGVEIIRAPTTVEDWLIRHGRHVREVLLARPEIAEKLIPLVRSHTTARISYYTHDLHHLRLQREAALKGDRDCHKQANRIRAQECGIFASVDCILSPSQDEAEIIATLVSGADVKVLLPYYYDEADIRARDRMHFETCCDVIFVGGFPHVPNVDAALFIANEIMPLVWARSPQTKLVLVGYGPPPEVRNLANERIVVTGQVPSLAPYYDRARVTLAALRYGGGVKGKVVDALRQGVPVVATPVGAEGIGITSGREALVADNAADLAEAVLRLLGDSQHCAELSEAGAALIRHRYSRESARKVINAVFRTPRCAVCGSSHVLVLPAECNYREEFICRNCFALTRSEALGQVILKRFGREGEQSLVELIDKNPNLDVYEIGFVGAIHDAFVKSPRFVCSEYFEDVPRGQTDSSGVRCEDTTCLTFANESFDLVVSQDVFEHVSDPDRGFAEVARVLRPGGAHIFTVPQAPHLETSVTRARIRDGLVEHVLPPEYHGDPVRAEGALVFTDFGADLKAKIADAGMALSIHEIAVPGHIEQRTVHVFEALKPKTVGARRT